MGLIKAGMGAIGGVLADQWKEYFYCDSMTPDVLMCKGQKRISSQGRSSNTSAEDNIISNGSVIAVNVGQCMMIVEQGKVVDLCAEPGEYTYDKSTEPSVFTGDLKESVSVLLSAAIPVRISVFITSTRKKLSATNTAPRRKFLSRLLKKTPAAACWYVSAALVNTATRSLTRSCSILRLPATLLTNTCGASGTAS